MKSIANPSQSNREQERQGLTLVEALIYFCVLSALVVLIACLFGSHEQQRRQKYNGGFLRGIIHAIQDDEPERLSPVVRRTRPDLIGYFHGHTLVTDIHEEHRDTFRQQRVALVIERLEHREEIDSKLRESIVQFLQSTGSSFAGAAQHGTNAEASGTPSP